MALETLDALQAAARPVRPALVPDAVLLAGAGGLLGSALLEALSARGRTVRPLAAAPLRPGLRGVLPLAVPGGVPGAAGWPAPGATTAIVQFESALPGSGARPGRHQRERALWTPQPADLPALARWLHAGGVRTLAVVQPHDAGRLPDALKRGLASLDEQAVAALGFERLLLVRSARAPAAAAPQRHPLRRLAAAMLGVAGYLVPAADRPVRAAAVAALVLDRLDTLPAGVHVIPPEAVWAAAQSPAPSAAAAVRLP